MKRGWQLPTKRIYTLQMEASIPIAIKWEETVRLARTLKQSTGLPMAIVIHGALEERMRRLRNTAIDEERKLAQMRAISRPVARMPDNDPRPTDEISGYDENGLAA